VYYTAEENDGMVAVPVGAFADPTFPPPTVSVYSHRKHSWVQMPDDLSHD
jgi:hypothetical protein